MARARIEIPVKTRFGKLVVLGEGEPIRYGKTQYLNRTMQCRCDCGAVVDVPVRGLLYTGRQQCSRSCVLGVNVKHGLATRANRDPIYNCWQSILARCENPRATGYKYWGGRKVPIEVYGPWHDPLVFKAGVEQEIGPRPSTDMTIERKDVNGNYEPGNIAWLEKAKQPLTRRRVYNATEVEEMLTQHHCPGCRCSR